MTVMDFFIEVLGFAIQTFPVGLLMFVPFDEGHLKCSRRKINAVFFIVSFLFSAVFAVFETIAGPDLSTAFADMYMVVFIAVIIIAFFRLVRSNILNRLVALIIPLHYAAIIFTVSNVAVRAIRSLSQGLMPADDVMYSYSPLSAFVYFAATLLTFPALFMFMSRVVRPALNYSDNKTMRRGFIYVTSALVLYCAALMFLDFSYERSVYRDAGVIVFFSAFIVTDCILYYMFFSEIKLVIENDRLANRIQSFDEQYRRINRSIEEFRRMRHDIRHHMNAISAMNRRGETKEISEYLEAYSTAYGELDDIQLCGYHALDNILRYYISIAREKDIAVKTEVYPVRQDMEFDVTDITVLAGNLMENAVEACEHMPSDAERYINVWIKQTDVSLLIRIENSCSGELDAQTSLSDGENFVSTKHSKHGGQGMKSIRLAAEKYGGSAEFKRENGRFTARIVLNIP